MKYDKVILGAGIYGLYSALYSAKKGEKVIVLEYDNDSFSRASYINQARVHNGYHYPRSISTALKSSNYFNRFSKDFSFAINKKFKKIYAISSNYSWTSGTQFELFCKNANIKCERAHPNKYFKHKKCDAVFETEEYAFDANKLKQYFLKEIIRYKNVDIKYNIRMKKIINNYKEKKYNVCLKEGQVFSTKYLLNSTYASVNQILNFMNVKMFKIKYEICEIILCKVSKNIKDVGITVMDGPFFSIMPFGKTDLHSLTSVTFTPHRTSYDKLPTFSCQDGIDCSPYQLGNCNKCLNKPNSAWEYMSRLSKEYLKEDISINYEKSLFAIKPILKSSEIDDSRPTIIKMHSDNPTFISVLSGKINTFYDLEEVL